MRTYNLFISHSWTYGDAYEKLINMLNGAPYFSYRNYSVPKNNPIHDAPNAQLLYEAIKRQIAPSQVVLILAGVYSSYSKWIDKEIKIATSDFSKPIIAIQPWGAEKTSQKVKSCATRVVNWSTTSIVSAVKDIA